MNRTDPPWAHPAGTRAAAGGGAIEVRRQTIGNNGTQSQKASARFPRHARSAAIRQTGGNAGTAKPEATGRTHPPYARSVTGYFASVNAKKGRYL